MKKEKGFTRHFGTNRGGTVTLYIVLRVLVIGLMIYQLFQQNYENVFVCALTLALFLIPLIVERGLKIEIPSALEATVLLFIFAAEILGEINAFYVKIPYWDTMLHTINGFIMAAVGFAMIDILNRHPRFHINMSPLFVAVVAFCFSMTIGVLWEFFEFTTDNISNNDMQKDAYYQTIKTVKPNADGENVPVIVRDIDKVVIYGTPSGEAAEKVMEDGTLVLTEGYLDIGLYDTMKDLIVNCIGAVVFSVIGALYIKQRDRGAGIVAGFVPRLKTEEELAAEQKKLEEWTARLGRRKKTARRQRTGKASGRPEDAANQPGEQDKQKEEK